MKINDLPEVYAVYNVGDDKTLFAVPCLEIYDVNHYDGVVTKLISLISKYVSEQTNIISIVTKNNLKYFKNIEIDNEYVEEYVKDPQYLFFLTLYNYYAIGDYVYSSTVHNDFSVLLEYSFYSLIFNFLKTETVLQAKEHFMHTASTTFEMLGMDTTDMQNYLSLFGTMFNAVTNPDNSIKIETVENKCNTLCEQVGINLHTFENTVNENNQFNDLLDDDDSFFAELF